MPPVLLLMKASCLVVVLPSLLHQKCSMTISDLKVISRTRAVAFKGSTATNAEIARQLGVANVITGSVRRAQDHVRITLELRRASDDALLWSLPMLTAVALAGSQMLSSLK